MAVAAEIQVRDKLFIGGEWVDPAGSETIDVVNASTEEVMGTDPARHAEDVDRAVARRARRLRRPGRRPRARSAPSYLAAIAAGLGARSDEIAATISQEVGMPIGAVDG